MAKRIILGMEFELRRISHSERLSEETNAYAADLYIDGKLFAHVSNKGFGGCDDQNAPKGTDHVKFHDEINALNARLKAEAPKITSVIEVAPGKFFETDCDIEGICGELLTDHLIEKDLKRALGKVLVAKGGKVYTTGYKGVRKHTDEQVRKIADEAVKEDPSAIVLNLLPFDKALEIYRRDAR